MHRIGVIGLGRIATNRHLPAIASNPEFALAGLTDPVADFPPGVPGFRSHAEMLAQAPDIDAVVIATPPSVRCVIALDAFAAGKHVMIEKPPTATVAELMLLRQAAEQAGRVLFTAWHAQFNAAVDAARTRLRGSKVTGIDVLWKEDVNRWHPGQAWIWQPGGFGVFDPGINALSILTRILPERLSIRTSALTIPGSAAAPIAARLEFCLGGRHITGGAQFDWRHAAAEQREITISTEDRGILRLEASGRRLLVEGENPLEGDREEYTRVYRHLAGLLRRGESDFHADPLILACDALAIGSHAVMTA